jgi:D-alanyl-D-alanine carboxypeptidase
MRRHARFRVRSARPLVFCAVLVAIAGCQAAAPVASPAAGRSSDPSGRTASAGLSPSAIEQSAVAPSPSASTMSLTAFGALPRAKLGPARAAAMHGVLDAVVHDGAPDVIAAVITADGSWSGAAGVGGPDGRKATVDDEFAIASVTKVLTATLVIRLAEAGKIELDAPLSRYLGDVKADTNGATVRQALGMRSGMADFASDSAAAIGADPAHHWTAGELIARIPIAEARPGERWIKSGPGYMLLGLAVEHVTGKSLADALRSEILDLVGAKRILQQGAGVPTPKPWALPMEGYLGAFKIGDLGAGGAISCISSASFGPGSGSIASDAPSLAAWTWHLFAGHIVDQSSLAAMLPATDGHGLGLEKLDSPLDAAIGLTGGKTGYGTVLAVDPVRKIVAVVLVNDENFRIDSYIVDLMRIANGG